MSARPLEKLPTIRGKLGSTIVVAVGITIFISYALIGFALAELAARLRGDRRARDGSQGGERRGERPAHGHDDRAALGHRGAHRLGREPGHPAADLRGRGAALGRGGQERLRLAAAGRWLVGHGADALAHARIPGAGLGDAGVPAEPVVAVPAGRHDRRGDRPGDLAMARPRHDPAAPRHGRGRPADGDGRLHRAGAHHQPRRGGPARHGVQPDESGTGEPGDLPARSRRQRLPRAEDADHGDPGPPGEPARRRGAAQPRDAPGDAGAVRTAGPPGRAAPRSVEARVRRSAAAPGGRAARPRGP